MEPSSAHERLFAQVMATKPAGPLLCILCQDSADHVGVGRIDAVMMAYGVCTACVGLGYVDSVIAKVRAWHASRRHN